MVTALFSCERHFARRDAHAHAPLLISVSPHSPRTPSAIEEDATLAAAKLHGSELAGRKIQVSLAASGAEASAEAVIADGRKPRARSAPAAPVAAAPADAAPIMAGDSDVATIAAAARQKYPSGALGVKGADTAKALPAAEAKKVARAAAAPKAVAAPALAATAAPVSAPRSVSAHAASRGRSANQPPPSILELLKNGNLRVRSVVLLGFGTDADYKKIWVRVRKAAGVEDMAFPVHIPGSEARQAAVIRFATRETRDSAVSRFDGRELCGARVAARAGDSALFGREAKDTSRLIVRNLHFEATVDQLRSAITRCVIDEDSAGAAAAGGSAADVRAAAEKARAAAALAATTLALTDLSLPIKQAPSGDSNADVSAPAHRGFAFLEFLTRADAGIILAALNGKKVHKRVIAVDWALNKNDYAKASAEVSERESEIKRPADDVLQAAVDSDDDGADAAAKEADVVADDTSAAPATAPRAAVTDDARLGTTLFLRNVGFDTRDADLVAAFRAFGPVRYARVVVDDSTGRSRGTAFVQFFNKGGADAVLDAAFSRDEHWEPADPKRPSRIAEAIEASKLTGGVHVAERKLMVARAISKDEALQLAAARAAKDGVGPSGKKFDARHLYLSHEGNIREGSEAAAAMLPSDLAKRVEAITAKKAKLKSPLFFVNPTRLLIKGLARSETDKSLAARAAAAAAAGVAARLVDVREGDIRLMPPIGAADPPLKVLKAKIVRDVVTGANATDAREGRAPRFEADGVTPRSKGFAFVEFSCHYHALAALRELNNNPAYSDAALGGAAAKAAKKPQAEWPRLIVEFAVENIVTVRAHEAKKAGARARSLALKTAGGSSAEQGEQEEGDTKEKAKRVRPSRREVSGVGKRKADALRAEKSGDLGDDQGRSAKADPPAAKAATTAVPALKKQNKRSRATESTAEEAPKVSRGPKVARTERSQGDAELDDLVADVNVGHVSKRRRGFVGDSVAAATASDGPAPQAAPPRRAAKKKALSAEAARDAMIESYRQSLYS